MVESGKYNLLLTNQRRVRWLWWGLLAYVVGGVGLLGLHFLPSFGLVIGPLVVLLGAVMFYDKLFRQPGWVLVTADSITWVNSATNSPGSWQFAEVRTYRFELYRNGIKLFLYLHNNQKIKLDAQYSLEYGAMQKAFEQAVRRYNQAYSEAEITVEKTFFERQISSKILLGLLVASAVWVAWNISQQATAVAYFPVVMILVPYLGTWAGYSGRRE
ncbi:MAG: hypothetical protein ACRYFZ_20065 [Janthinobacterium lividum]